jgi:predicted nucleic acid-binding protein
MSALVLDCSIVMAWCFEDEASPACDEVLDGVKDTGAIVPSLWYWEVGNVLATAQRRGRIAERDTVSSLKLLSELPIVADDVGASLAWHQTRLLAQTHSLSVYDAAYLELALRTGGILASLDKSLRTAAIAAGVEVRPLL